MAHPGRPRNCDPRVKLLFIDVEKKRNEKVVSVLKETGIDAPDGDGRTALIHAAAYNNFSLVKWLLENNASINYQDRIGYTALHFTGQNKFVEIAAYLLNKGANPNIQDIHGNSPLWTAIFNSMEEKGVVKLLLQYGANIDLNNKYGRTPRTLYQTIYNNDIILTDFLER